MNIGASWRAPALALGRTLALLVAASAWTGAGASQAPTSPVSPVSPASTATPAFEAPPIGRHYAEAVAQLPDWNGTWEMTGASGTHQGETALFDPAHIYVPPRPAADIGFDVGPEPGTRLTAVPYKPQYEKQYEAAIQKAIHGESEDPVGACQPYGMPRIMFGTPYGPQILVTPEAVVMVLFKGETRLIYTDGRSHPSGANLLPSWEGHSIGQWHGDTLVVDTIGIYPGNYDQSDAPHSGQLHLIERIRLIASNTLEDRMTIHDPVMLTRPWTVTRRYLRSSRSLLEAGRLNFVCPPNNGVDFSQGYQRVILPSERHAPNESH